MIVLHCDTYRSYQHEVVIYSQIDLRASPRVDPSTAEAHCKEGEDTSDGQKFGCIVRVGRWWSIKDTHRASRLIRGRKD